MDGGSVSCTLLFRIRPLPDKKVTRLFNINDPKIVPISWVYGEEAFGERKVSLLRIPWIVLKTSAKDESSSVGLPASIWKKYWIESAIEVDLSPDGESWRELTERDWEGINART